MPEVNGEDYTTGELTSAANACRDAVDLLTPTADELTRIAAEVELVEEELHFTRTSRHLNAAALHLTISEKTIRRIAKQVGRTYRSITGWLLLQTMIATLVSLALAILTYFLSGKIQQFSGGFFSYACGFWGGTLIAHGAIKTRIRRKPRDL